MRHNDRVAEQRKKFKVSLNTRATVAIFQSKLKIRSDKKSKRGA